MARSSRGDLDDTQFARIEPFLPSDEGKRGSRWSDHRRVINGILWVQRTGAPWRDLPERYGPYTTCHDRLLRWQNDGTWTKILQALQAQAEQDGDLDWEEGALDASVVKAHQHAAGAPKRPKGTKKGASHRPKAPPKRLRSKALRGKSRCRTQKPWGGAGVD